MLFAILNFADTDADITNAIRDINGLELVHKGFFSVPVTFSTSRPYFAHLYQAVLDEYQTYCDCQKGGVMWRESATLWGSEYSMTQRGWDSVIKWLRDYASTYVTSAIEYNRIPESINQFRIAEIVDKYPEIFGE